LTPKLATRALYAWAEADLDGALSLLSEPGITLSEKERGDFLSKVVAVGAHTKPERIRKYVEGLDEQQQRTHLKEIFPALFKRDPKAIAAEVERFPTALAPLRVARDTVMTDPKVIAEVAAALPGERARGTIYQSAAEWKMALSPEQAATWASSVKDPLGRQAAVSTVAGMWTRLSPAKAVEFASKQISERNDALLMDRLIGTIANSKDGENVFSDLRQNLSGPARDHFDARMQALRQSKLK
jgi:hypothetical protein